MVRTGANSYVRYGWQSAFGTAANDSALDKPFGINQRLTNWSLSNSPKDLATLGQVELDDYAYGQQTGSAGVDFVLSNPWIFKAIYGSPASNTASGVTTHTYGTTGGVHAAAKNVQPFTTEVGFQPENATNTTVVRRGIGCVLNSLGINTTVDGTVNCSADISYGQEDHSSGSVYTTGFDTTPPTDDIAFPYTFAHGSVKWNDGSSLATVAEVQDVSITFAQNPTLLYGVGDHKAVASFRRVLDITGSFRASWLDEKKINQLLDQIRSDGTAKETVGTATSVDLELFFTNSASTTSEKSIKVKLEGIRPDSVAIDGIQPVEPVFENIAWRTKRASVVAVNAIGTAK